MKGTAKNQFKKITLLVVVLSVAFVIYASYFSAGYKQQDSFAKEIIDRPSPIVTAEPPPVAEFRSDSVEDGRLPSSPLDGISTADARDNIFWYSERGHFGSDELSAYSAYDDKTLQEMIKNHDMRAAEAMGNKLIDRGDIGGAIDLFYLAAAQGSSGILLNLSHLTEPPHKVGETTAERKEVYRNSVIESLAILKTMSIRGDIRMAALGMETQKKSYETLAKEPLVLLEVDLKYIDRRGQEIYDDLQHKRYELGLGDFDNSTSKVEQLLYKYFYGH